MKVALIRQKYTPFGGAERFVSQALEALEKRVELTLLTRAWNAETQKQPRSWKVRYCDPFYFGRTWRDWSFAKAVRNVLLENAYDVVQSHERIYGCDIYRAGDGVHQAWLQHKHQHSHRWVRWLSQRLPYHWYQLNAERKLFLDPRLKAVICNSKLVQQEIIRHFKLPAERLPVIYNGVDLDRFHPDLGRYRSPLRADFGIPDSADVLLFMGSGFSRKGLGVAIDALAQTTHQPWLLVVGKDRWLERYRKQAKRRGVANRIVFAGPQAEVLAFYGASDACVLPTLYDPFPNVALEAWASGLPFITSSSCGAAECVRHGENGYVYAASDVSGFSSAFDAICERSRHPRMRQAARETALSFSLERMATEMQALYRRLGVAADAEQIK